MKFKYSCNCNGFFRPVIAYQHAACGPRGLHETVDGSRSLSLLDSIRVVSLRQLMAHFNSIDSIAVILACLMHQTEKFNL